MRLTPEVNTQSEDEGRQEMTELYNKDFGGSHMILFELQIIFIKIRISPFGELS